MKSVGQSVPRMKQHRSPDEDADDATVDDLEGRMTHAWPVPGGESRCDSRSLALTSSGRQIDRKLWSIKRP